jgi:glycosyltransferase involved in cell wall biosynthesis
MNASQLASPIPVDNPLVSIAIPTYNRVSWLKGCVEAALAQTYRNIEIIVSDNASTDNTVEMLGDFNDPRLRIVQQQTNIGPAPNCNACIAAAKGEYIVIVPDDDRIAPTMLERCMQLIRKAPGIPIVITIGDIYMGSNNQVRPCIASRKLATGIWDGADILLEYLNDQLSVHQCSVLFHTATLRAHGGFAVGYPFAGDIATWLPILLLGKAGLVNESCGLFSVHEATLTSKFEIDTRIQDIRRIVDLVQVAAQKTVPDIEKRRALELRSKGYFARHAIGLVSAQHGEGVTWSDLLPSFRRWRRDIWVGFRYMGANNASSLLRNLALLVLPLPLIYAIRRSVRAMR